MQPEPSDPVQHADQRGEKLEDGDVRQSAKGSNTQRGHGNMDASLVSEGKGHPEEGAYQPEHDLFDPDSSPDASRDHP